MKMFSCAQTSNQRAESNNNRIKSDDELPNYNMFQLQEHLLSLFQRQEEKSMREIKECIQKGYFWSDYVNDQWNNEFQKLGDFSAVQNAGTSTTWEVKPYNNSNICHVVSIFEDSFPTCSCGIFTSTRIPCRHICKVYSMFASRLKQPSNLHPRWLLCNHPLYSKVVSEMNIGSVSLTLQNNLSTSETNDNTMILSKRIAEENLKLYQNISYPSTEAQRFQKISEGLNKLKERGLSNEHNYKRLMMLINQSIININIHYYL